MLSQCANKTYRHDKRDLESDLRLLTDKYNRLKGQLEIKQYETDMNFEAYRSESELSQSKLR